MEDEAFLTIKSEPTATSAEAATPRSMFLITDIILVVTDVLRRKRDLKNLALCSKALLANVRPRLYREITVNTALLASRGGRSWDALIQPNNLGLLQIRSITVDYHSESEEHLVASAVEHLFTVIPPDTLTSFEWNAWTAMPQPLNRTLWETQHCLRKYDLTSSEAPILDSTGTYNERSHQAHRNVTRLDVSRTAPLDPRHAAHVLEQCPINELLVHIDHEMSMPPGENIDEVDCDGNLTLDRLAPTIFRAWLVPSMGRPLHTPIALKKLDLFRINLQYAQSTWLVAIDFSRMEALYIDECQHAYKFFEAASARKQGMLRNVRELHVEFFRESDDGLTESLSRSLEHCLTSVFRSLRTLKIVLYWADRMPHVEALSAHKRTLQQLMIEVYDRWEIQLDYDVQKIEQLLAGMCVLDDLAIAIPIHWSAPVNAVEDVRLDAWVDSPGGEHLFAIFKHVQPHTLCLLTLPPLANMESFNWPGHAPRAMLLRFARKAFVTSLEYSSTQIPSPTNLVIIGSHGFGQEQNNILNCYVAGTKTFFGEQSLAVARIPLRRVELEFGTSALLLSDTTSFHNNDFDAAEASTRLDQFE